MHISSWLANSEEQIMKIYTNHIFISFNVVNIFQTYVGIFVRDKFVCKIYCGILTVHWTIPIHISSTTNKIRIVLGRMLANWLATEEQII